MASFEQLRRRFPDILGEREPLILRLRPPALFYSVRIPEKTRDEANRLCAKLRSRGAACAVLRNPTATKNSYAVGVRPRETNALFLGAYANLRIQQ